MTIDRYVTNARILAQDGLLGPMQKALEFAAMRAQGRDVPERQEIEQICYGVVLGQQLADAKGLAQSGRARDLDAALERAQTSAQKAGEDISEQLADIYGDAARAQLALAGKMTQSDEHNPDAFEEALRHAARYAGKKRLDISAHITEIQERGYKVAIPGLLAQAEEFAKRGAVKPMHARLFIATGYAERTGQDIAARVVQIKALVPK